MNLTRRSLLTTAEVPASAMGVDNVKLGGAATGAAMKKMRTDDDCFGPGAIRADGRKLHPAFLWEVKKPAGSNAPWDYYKLLATTSADQAFRPIDKGACPLVRS
jgi:branched-chain amino acid transport system substrate-binding protein